MTRVSLPFIPPSELAEVLAGSFQEITARVVDGLQAEAHTLFGGKTFQVLGVFPDAAVVLVEGDGLSKIHYSLGAGPGVVYFTRTEPLSVTVVTEQNLQRFLRQEARAAADLFLQGLVAQAHEKIAMLAPLADSLSSRPEDPKLTAFLEGRTNPAWKRTVRTQAERIAGIISESQLPAPMKPRFQDLYADNPAAGLAPDLQVEVAAQANELVSRLGKVAAQAEAAIQAARSVVASISDAAARQPVEALENFASSLLADAEAVKAFVSEALAEADRVDRLAQVFDSVASEVASFEVAGAFAANMAARLT